MKTNHFIYAVVYTLRNEVDYGYKYNIREMYNRTSGEEVSFQ